MPEEQNISMTDYSQKPDASRKRRRDEFLADLAEAQKLRERVAPRRARMARLRQQQLMRTVLH